MQPWHNRNMAWLAEVAAALSRRHAFGLPPPAMPVPHRFAVSVLRHLPTAKVTAWRYYNYFLRLSGATKIGSSHFGGRIHCRLDDIIGQYIYHFGVWELHVSALIASRLHTGDVFCDVGANVGYYTVIAAGMVGRTGSVVAIEPSPAMFEQLERNIELSRVHSVRLANVAVGASDGIVTLYRGPARNPGLATIAPTRARVEECKVAMRTLDTILTSDERRRLRLLKIDVEGAERPILRNVLDTLDLYSPELEIVVEVAPHRALDAHWTVEQIVEEFAQHGFHAFAVPNSYSAQSYLDLREPVAPQAVNQQPVKQQDLFFSRTP